MHMRVLRFTRKGYNFLMINLLYNSRLHLFLGKLRSRWASPNLLCTFFLHGAVELENPKNGQTFKVNGQRLKAFLEDFPSKESVEVLVDPVYQDLSGE